MVRYFRAALTDGQIGKIHDFSMKEKRQVEREVFQTMFYLNRSRSLEGVGQGSVPKRVHRLPTLGLVVSYDEF